MNNATTTTAPIDSDLYCVNCGYNLRTLAAAGLCPECATPVEKSTLSHARSRELSLRRLSLGAACLVLPPAVEAVGHILEARWLYWNSPHHIDSDLLDFLVQTSPGLIRAALATLAIHLLSRSTSPHPRHTLIARLCFAYPILIAAGEAAHIVTYFQTPPTCFGPASPLWRSALLTSISLEGLQGLTCASLCVVASFFFRSLARLLTRPWLSWLGLMCFFIVGFCAVQVVIDSALRLCVCAPRDSESLILKWPYWFFKLVRAFSRSSFLWPYTFWSSITAQTVLWTALALTAWRIPRSSARAGCHGSARTRRAPLQTT